MSLTARFFVEQDRIVLLAVGLMLAAVALAWPSIRPPVWGLLERKWDWGAAGLAVGAVGFAGWGTFHLFRRFNLSRDEIMADFDAKILASGRLLAGLPDEWRGFRDALNPIFLLPIPDPSLWVSSYLPGNAALRAGISLVADPGWTNPILLGVAILAVASISRRLWPDRRGPQIVAVILLASSPQALTTAMTSYAMTAHLALNLLWLALFLRNDGRGHIGAVLVGWLATGLHQTIFHPLFVAPFIMELYRQGRHGLATLYSLAYAAIFSFWTLYWKLLLVSFGLSSEGPQDVGFLFLLVRVWLMLSEFSIGGLDLMAMNLLRFIAWQNLAALVLVLISWRAVAAGEGVARQLAAGLALTVAAMFILLPYQGHGWGYRYLHGLLGSVSLLAGYGWTLAASGSAADRARASTGLVVATAATLLVLLPLRLSQANDFVEPYRAAYARLEASQAEAVVVDPRGIPFGGDLVQNDPFLRNAPKILDYTQLTPHQLELLCSRMTLAAFDRQDAARVGLQGDPAGTMESPEGRLPARAALVQSGCSLPPPPAAD